MPCKKEFTNQTSQRIQGDWGRCMSRNVLIIGLGIFCLWHNVALAQVASSLPGHAGQVMLIKNTLVAVSHGNITGNYTVLRDLASERFRQQNTAADLAVTFAALRKQKLDLSPILVAEPQLTQEPAIDQFRGRLQLVGYFSTQPKAVRFALVFQLVQGGWVIDEVSVAVVPAESIVTAQRATPAVTPQPAQARSRDSQTPRYR